MILHRPDDPVRKNFGGKTLEEKNLGGEKLWRRKTLEEKNFGGKTLEGRFGGLSPPKFVRTGYMIQKSPIRANHAYGPGKNIL